MLTFLGGGGGQRPLLVNKRPLAIQQRARVLLHLQAYILAELAKPWTDEKFSSNPRQLRTNCASFWNKMPYTRLRRSVPPRKVAFSYVYVSALFVCMCVYVYLFIYLSISIWLRGQLPLHFLAIFFVFACFRLNIIWHLYFAIFTIQLGKHEKMARSAAAILSNVFTDVPATAPTKDVGAHKSFIKVTPVYLSYGRQASRVWNHQMDVALPC